MENSKHRFVEAVVLKTEIQETMRQKISTNGLRNSMKI